jgi:hypothetical protein
MDNNTAPQTNGTEAFLLKLGPALLKERRREWMDANEVEEYCNAQGIQIDGKRVDGDELESKLRGFFQLTGEFYAPGLSIDGYERRVGWEKIFQIRVYPHGSFSQSTNNFSEEGTDITQPASTLDKQPESPGEWAKEKSS